MVTEGIYTPVPLTFFKKVLTLQTYYFHDESRGARGLRLATKKKVTRKRGSQNYLNNARLMENIIASKAVWDERRDVATAQWVEEHDVEGIECFADYAAAIEKKDGKPPKRDFVEEGATVLESEDYFPSAAECMTDELVKMIMMLVERYGQRSNWRGYTYIDDMKSEALVSLLNGTLKFDPAKSQNPFGYMTQIVTHSFLTTLDKEKKVRKIRDDILEQNGFTPSHTRQLENEAAAMERHRRMADEKEGIISEEEDSESD